MLTVTTNWSLHNKDLLSIHQNIYLIASQSVKLLYNIYINVISFVTDIISRTSDGTKTAAGEELFITTPFLLIFSNSTCHDLKETQMSLINFTHHVPKLFFQAM